MAEFFSASISYPTILWSLLLCVALFYWILAIIGAVGVDLLDAGADVADGAGDALEGAADAIDGTADAADGASEAADGASEVAESSAQISDYTGFLSLFRRRQAPLTVVLTVFFFWNWLLNHLTVHYLSGVLNDLVPIEIWGTGFLLFYFWISQPLSRALLIPMAPIFETHHAITSKDLIGEVVEVQTSRVDEKFGQASLEDGGAGLILQVRCRPEQNLKKGDRALIVRFDRDDESYRIEPMNRVNPNQKEQLEEA